MVSRSSGRDLEHNTSAIHKPLRNLRLGVSPLGFVILAATLLTLINAPSVLQRASESFTAPSRIGFISQTLVEITLLWCGMAALLLPAVFNNRLLKVWTLFLLCIGLIATYYVVRLNIGIDDAVIRSILSTDQQEVAEFIDPLSFLLPFVIVGATAVILSITRIVSRRNAPGSATRVFAPRPSIVLSVIGAMILGVLANSVFGDRYAKQFFHRGLPRYSPLNLVVEGPKYGLRAWETRRVVTHDISSQFRLDESASASGREVVVIVIGESARAANFQLAGYERPTNPRMSAEPDLIFFRDVTACRTHTNAAVSCLLTRFGSAKLTIPVTEVSLITILKRLGFQTRWYGVQSPWRDVYRICQEADFCKVSIRTRGRQALDEKLLPFLEKSLTKRKDGHLLVVLHQLGSHAKYSARYPPAFAHYRPECKGHAYTCARAEVVNSYDNSILYTDHVLGEVIELLRKERAILFFTPDHGESLGELAIYGHGWPIMLAPKEQMKVPLVIWASPSFIAARRDDWARLRKAASKSISHDYFFHTVLGCSGLRSSLLRSDRNLCAEPSEAENQKSSAIIRHPD